MSRGENKNTLNKNEKEHFYRKLFSIVAPIAAQSLISSTLSLVDTVMVGRLGEAEVAAVSVAFQVFFLQWMIVMGFTGGCGTFMSQFFGAGDARSIRKTLGFDICVAMGISTIFFAAVHIFPYEIVGLYSKDPAVVGLAVAYLKILSFSFFTISFVSPATMALRATQQTKVPMYVSIAAFGSNTLLNFILIFGLLGFPALGVVGAAIATLFARILEIVLIFYYACIKKNILAGPFRDYVGWHRDLLKKIIRNAWPTTLNEGFWCLAQTTFMVAYAKCGTTAFAAMEAAYTINDVFILAGFSFGDAILIMCGQKLGEGKAEEAFLLSRKLITIIFAIGICAAVVQVSISWLIVGLFNFTPLGIHYCKLLLVVCAIFLPLNLMENAILTGALRCGGDTLFAMAAELSIIWLIGVPAAFLCVLHFGMEIYWALAITCMYNVVETVVLIIRWSGKKWLNNMVEEFEGKRAKSSAR